MNFTTNFERAPSLKSKRRSFGESSDVRNSDVANYPTFKKATNRFVEESSAVDDSVFIDHLENNSSFKRGLGQRSDINIIDSWRYPELPLGTEQKERGSYLSDKRARTEGVNYDAYFNAYGLNDIYQEEIEEHDESWGIMDGLTPAFDMLQVGGYQSANITEALADYATTGEFDWQGTFVAGGAELTNSLTFNVSRKAFDGINKNVKRHTFEDILAGTGRHGKTDLSEWYAGTRLQEGGFTGAIKEYLDEEYGIPETLTHLVINSNPIGQIVSAVDDMSPQWKLAIDGMILDVALDPFTYTGYGTVINAYKFGIKAIDKGLAFASQADTASDFIAKSAVGEEFVRKFRPDGLIKRIHESDDFAQNYVDGYNEVMKIINKDSADITLDEFREGAHKFLHRQTQMEIDIASQKEKLRENILGIANNMTAGERRLVGLYLDQGVGEGTRLYQIIDNLKVADEVKTNLKEGAVEFKEIFEKVFKDEVDVNLLSKAQFRENYMAGLEPVGDWANNVFNKLIQLRFGDDVVKTTKSEDSTILNKVKEASRDIVQTRGKFGFLKHSLPKMYKNTAERVHNAVATELDIAVVASRRGSESIKKVMTQKLLDTTVYDHRISIPVDFNVANASDEAGKAIQQTLHDHGFKIWEAPTLSLHKGRLKGANMEQVYFAMPAPYVDNLNDMTRFFDGSDPTGWQQIKKSYDKVQGIWKSYALMSPGYHARNVYSNIFNNWIAGVDDPTYYAEAFLLQVEDTANISNTKVRSMVEKTLGGRKSIDNYTFIQADGTKINGRQLKEEYTRNGVDSGGMIFNESDMGVAQDLLTTFEMSGRPSYTEIAKGLDDWGDASQRIENQISVIRQSVLDAGAEVDEKQIEDTARLYDVVARAWAWKNVSTPEAFYSNYINQIRAASIDDSVPMSDNLLMNVFNQQHSTPHYFVGKDKDNLPMLVIDENIRNPDNFKRNIGRTVILYNTGRPSDLYHGSPRHNKIVTGYDDRGLGERRSRWGLVGPAFYTTEDVLGSTIGEPLINLAPQGVHATIASQNYTQAATFLSGGPEVTQPFVASTYAYQDLIRGSLDSKEGQGILFTQYNAFNDLITGQSKLDLHHTLSPYGSELRTKADEIIDDGLQRFVRVWNVEGHVFNAQSLSYRATRNLLDSPNTSPELRKLLEEYSDEYANPNAIITSAIDSKTGEVRKKARRKHDIASDIHKYLMEKHGKVLGEREDKQIIKGPTNYSNTVPDEFTTREWLRDKVGLGQEELSDIQQTFDIGMSNVSKEIRVAQGTDKKTTTRVEKALEGRIPYDNGIPSGNEWSLKMFDNDDEAMEIINLLSISRSGRFIEEVNYLMANHSLGAEDAGVLVGHGKMENPYVMDYIKPEFRIDPYTGASTKEKNIGTEVLEKYNALGRDAKHDQIEVVMLNKQEVTQFEERLLGHIAEDYVSSIRGTFSAIENNNYGYLDLEELYTTLQVLSKENKWLYNGRLKRRHIINEHNAKKNRVDSDDLEESLDEAMEESSQNFDLYASDPDAISALDTNVVQSVAYANNPVYHRVVYDKLIKKAEQSYRSKITGQPIEVKTLSGNIQVEKILDDVRPDQYDVNPAKLFNKEQLQQYNELMGKPVDQTLSLMALSDAKVIADDIKMDDLQMSWLRENHPDMKVLLDEIDEVYINRADYRAKGKNPVDSISPNWGIRGEGDVRPQNEINSSNWFYLMKQFRNIEQNQLINANLDVTATTAPKDFRIDNNITQKAFDEMGIIWPHENGAIKGLKGYESNVTGKFNHSRHFTNILTNSYRGSDYYKNGPRRRAPLLVKNKEGVDSITAYEQWQELPFLHQEFYPTAKSFSSGVQYNHQNLGLADFGTLRMVNRYWKPDALRTADELTEENIHAHFLKKGEFPEDGEYANPFYFYNKAIDRNLDNTDISLGEVGEKIKYPFIGKDYKVGYKNLLWALSQWGGGTGGQVWANAMLGRMGFDGITHTGGIATGASPAMHQVWAFFNGRNFKAKQNNGMWRFGDPESTAFDQMRTRYGEPVVAGQIQFLNDGPQSPANILLTGEGKNDTLIHELGHLVRRNLLDDADKDIIQRWIVGDKQYEKLYDDALERAKAWFEEAEDADIEGIATEILERQIWKGADGRKHEEMFADALLQFMGEGVSTGPKGVSNAMQGTFDRIKENLGLLYDFSEGGVNGIKLNDDTKKVLGRIVGRGADEYPEELEMARATLDADVDVSEGFFNKSFRLLGDNPLTRANRLFGKTLENNARIAHYIAMRTKDVGTLRSNGWLNKTKANRSMTEAEAVESVHRFLFDYEDLTPFERDVMKTIMPFYTWMRKNIPLQFQQMVLNPNRYAKIPKFQANVEAVTKDFEDVEEPDYFRWSTNMRIPLMSQDVPFQRGGQSVYMGLDLPFADINRLNTKDMISSMSPFLKGIVELYNNKGYNFFLDASLQKYTDEPASIEIGDTKIDLGINRKTLHAINTFLPPVGKVTRLLKRTGQGRLGEQLANELLGLGITTTDVEAVERARIYKSREVGRALKNRLEEKARLMGGLDQLPEAAKKLGGK